jgi:Holliday junction resolvase
MSRGADRERAVRKLLEEGGWIVFRSAGSFGVDLIAARDGPVLWPGSPSDRRIHVHNALLLIEVKSTAGSPYERFGPADRRRFKDAADRAGADALLAYWPPGKGLEWIASDQWPDDAD